MDNLIKCAPGDNTYDGVQTEISLVSTESPYHSIYTTMEVNGEEGGERLLLLVNHVVSSVHCCSCHYCF